MYPGLVFRRFVKLIPEILNLERWRWAAMSENALRPIPHPSVTLGDTVTSFIAAASLRKVTAMNLKEIQRDESSPSMSTTK